MSIDQPIYNKVGCKQRDGSYNQDIHFDSFYRPKVTCAHCFIGTQIYAEAGINLNYADDKIFQGHALIVSKMILSKQI